MEPTADDVSRTFKKDKTATLKCEAVMSGDFTIGLCFSEKSGNFTEITSTLDNMTRYCATCQFSNGCFNPDLRPHWDVVRSPSTSDGTCDRTNGVQTLTVSFLADVNAAQYRYYCYYARNPQMDLHSFGSYIIHVQSPIKTIIVIIVICILLILILIVFGVVVVMVIGRRSYHKRQCRKYDIIDETGSHDIDSGRGVSIGKATPLICS